jgi:hypothetical protein
MQSGYYLFKRKKKSKNKTKTKNCMVKKKKPHVQGFVNSWVWMTNP